MSDVFGVGTILGDAFAVVFRHIGRMLLIGAIPAIAAAVLNLVIYGAASQNVVMAVLDPVAFAAADEGAGMFAVAVVTLAGLAFWGFAGAALTRAAWDAHIEGGVDVRAAIGTGIARLVPVTIWLTLGAVVLYLGFFALIVPGLWLMGVWIALLPALVIERRGSGAFRRSAELTRGYRWPAVGLLVLFMLVSIVIGLLAVAVQGAAYLAGSAGVAIGTVISVVLSALYYALSSAIVALAYARLREIKEGGGRSLAEIFA